MAAVVMCLQRIKNKTKVELNALKEEVETVNKKLAELTDEELAQVSGGLRAFEPHTIFDTIFAKPAVQQIEDLR